MTWKLFALCGIFLLGCNNNSNSNSGGTAGDESTYSGSYSLIGIECYHNTTGEIVVSGQSVGFTSEVTIAGDNFTQTFTDADCSGTITGLIEFRTEDGTIRDADTTVPAGSCEINGSFNLTDSGGNTTTIPFTETMNASTDRTTSFQFARNETNGNIGITEFSQFRFPNASTCFSIYEKN